MQPIDTKIPATIPSTAINQTNNIDSVVSKADQLSNSYNNYLTQLGNLTSQYTQYSTPSIQEMNLGRELTALGQSERAGLQKISDKVIPMEFITGEQASLQNQAANQRLAISQNLATVQGERQAKLQALSDQLDLAKTSYGATGDYIKNQLDMEALQKEASKLDTNIVTLDNGRTLLVDTQTGNIIKDYGGIKPTDTTGYSGYGTTEPSTPPLSFEDWLSSKEMADGMSYDIGNPTVLADLQSQYDLEVPQETGNIGTGLDMNSLERNLLASKNITKQQREDIQNLIRTDGIEGLKDWAYYNRLNATQQGDYDLYDNAQSAFISALSRVESAQTGAGPYKALLEKSKPYLAIKRDKDYTDLRSVIEQGQAQLRKGYYGTAVTGTEAGNASKFLITDSDDIDTIVNKLENSANFLRFVNDAQIARSLGIPKPNIADYIQVDTPTVTKDLSSLRSKYGY